jgi:hypothetical protein
MCNSLKVIFAYAKPRLIPRGTIWGSHSAGGGVLKFDEKRGGVQPAESATLGARKENSNRFYDDPPESPICFLGCVVFCGFDRLFGMKMLRDDQRKVDARFELSLPFVLVGALSFSYQFSQFLVDRVSYELLEPLLLCRVLFLSLSWSSHSFSNLECSTEKYQ